MKKKRDLNAIIAQVDHIRDFFKSGDDILPFLGDLFQFLKDMMPLMSEINVSLKKGTENLPVATDRITDVNHTTELATTEIMDKLDNISKKISSVAKNCTVNSREELESIIDDVTDIHMSLQFQDITSQKLEHANRILGAVYDKFANLIKSAQSMMGHSEIGDNILEEIIANSENHRADKTDDDFQARVADTIRSEEISQDDIDQLFK
ncbi:MAG: hypothetical protein J7L22_09215 [Candidatus Marinimicrobia bacterium]|nr:hypothetical protein [Candidatus Neomarinimicrobiota bacterium]